MTDGELVFSSDLVQGRPRIQLLGSSRAEIEIPTPCRVHLMGPGRESADIDVRGCDFRSGTDGSNQLRKSRWEDRLPINLHVDLSEDAGLWVDGRMP